MKLRYKLALAALSGALALPLTDIADDLLGSTDQALTIVPSLLFAGAVLFPLLEQGRWRPARAAGLIAISIASFNAAIAMANTGFSFGPDFEDYVWASMVGAPIVLVGAALLLPVRVSAAYWSCGFAASVLLGIQFGSFIDEGLLAYVAFAVWHAGMALVIHAGLPATDLGARMAALPRRWFLAQWLAMLVLCALVYIDYWIGVWAYERHPKADAGERPYQAVEVFGYLNSEVDQSRYAPCYARGMVAYLALNYRYLEIQVDDPATCPIAAGSGYQHYFLAPAGDPHCQTMAATAAGAQRFSSQPETTCIGVRLTDGPVSELELRKIVDEVPVAGGLHTLRVTRKQVRRLQSGEIIYEKTCYSYHPRPGATLLPLIAYHGQVDCGYNYSAASLDHVLVPREDAWPGPDR